MDGRREPQNGGGRNRTRANCPSPYAIIRLFRYVRALDWILIAVGVVTAVIHGAALPVAMLVFGDLTNDFVNQFTSHQIANTEFRFDPQDIFDNPNFRCVIDPNIIQSGFYNFTNVTGGVVNCSEDFVLIPPLNNFQDVLECGVTVRARCLENEQFIRAIMPDVIAFGVLSVVVLIVGSLQMTSFQATCERQVHRIRLCFYRSILRQEIGWFDATPTGELTSRLSDDINRIHDGIGEKLAMLIQWVTTFIGGFVVAFIVQWRLTLVMLGATPFIAIAAASFSLLTLAFSSKELKYYALAAAVAESVLSSIRTVVAFGGEKKESERYNGRLREGKKVGMIRGLVVGFSLGLIYFIVFGCFAATFWYGASLIADEIIQAGEVVTVFFAVLIGAFSIGQAAPNLEKFVAAVGASRTVYDIIDRQPLIDSSLEEGVTPEVDGTLDLKFRDVCFSYPTRPTVEVMDHFSVKVNAGHTLALVGPSGSGKTTAVQLLLRFYDANSGEILVGGRDIRTLSLKWLRDNIGVVSQEPVLFDTTIADNIRLGKEDATMEEIEEAAKKANAHDFISQMPKGYDTVVGERGAQLSGGQKQRIAIARALVRNPRILLLDEATSSLDSESETIVQAALDKARLGCTSIVVAHRLSTIQNADVIASIDNGQLVEIGTHYELMERKGLYYQLASAQSSGLEDVPHRGRHQHQKVDSMPSHSFDIGPSPFRYFDTDGYASLLADESEKDAEPVLKKDNKLPGVPWSELLQLSMKDRWLILLGVIGAAAQGAVFPVSALLFGEVLRVYTFPFDQVEGLVHMWAGLFIAVGAASGIATFLKITCFATAGENLTFRLRSLTFKAILRQNLGWFDDERNSTGALTTTLSSDAQQVHGATSSLLGPVAEVFFAVVVTLIIALTASWILTIVALGLVPFVIIAGVLQLTTLKGYATTSKKAVQNAGKIAVESIENVHTVAALAAEDSFFHKYSEQLQQPYKYALRSTIICGLMYGYSNAVIFAAYAITFRFAAYLQTLPVDHLLYARLEEVYLVFIAVIFGALAIAQAGSFAPNYAKAKLSARRIFAIIERKPDIDSYSEDGTQLESLHGKITMEDVDFSYPTRLDVQVFQRMNLNVEPGQTLAFVGPSGVGKSTLVNLIERFYDPLSGSLKLDNTDLRDLNIQWLRAQIGTVFQEPALFDCSIADNIRYGANFREVTDEEVVEAAKAANIHDFIQSLPQGYETNVGERGTQLSGGQKQRVAIARALVRNPKVLLLDEATSSLDTESEKMVQEALNRARVGRTSIVIAHRLSTIYNADCIAVIQGGRVVEMGLHTELIAKKGLYYKLNSYQALATADEDPIQYKETVDPY